MLTGLTMHFKRALSNLKKSLLINFITTLTITIALLLLAGYLLLLDNVNGWIQVREEQFTVKIYVDDGISADAVTALTKQIGQMSNVREVEQRDRETVRREFLAKHVDFRPVLEGLTVNPFQTQLIAKLRDNAPAATKQSTAEIQKLPGVESVDFGGSWLERYVAVKGTLNIVSYLLGSLIILACLFLISNTIRLNIFTRKDEIEIYKLVGGTKPFIAAPFVIEGLMLGLLGACCAIGLLYVIWHFAIGGMNRELQYVTGNLQLVFLGRGAMLNVFGVALFSGFFGSLLSLRRFLRYN